MVSTTICATDTPGTWATETVSELDARLLALDPDLEELFAEVDEILCRASDRWSLLPPRQRRPRLRRQWQWRPGQCHGRRPGPARARGRGPPARFDAVPADK